MGYCVKRKVLARETVLVRLSKAVVCPDGDGSGRAKVPKVVKRSEVVTRSGAETCHQAEAARGRWARQREREGRRWL